MRPNAPSSRRGRLAFVAVALAFPLSSFTTVPDARAASSLTEPAARLTTSVSPDAHWLVLQTQRDGAEPGELSIVSLVDDVSHSLGRIECVDAPTWDAQGKLQLRVRDGQSSAVELRSIDPATGAVVSSERASEAEASASWARVEHRKSSDGHELVRIEWIARGLKFHLPTELGEFQLSETPGILFYTQANGNKRALLRHDMDRGTSEQLVVFDASTSSWSVSADERLLLVTESERPHRARVVDLRNGMLVDGPWPAESARWIDDGASRYVALVSRGRRTLVDRVRDRNLDLGVDQGPWPVIAPLPDGRFVVQMEQSVELRDDQLHTLRTLVAKAD